MMRGFRKIGGLMLLATVCGAARLGAQPADAPGGPGQGQGREGRGGGRRGGDPARFMERLDANGDGKVSADEFTGPKEMFDRMDANHDGFVTAEEMTAAREQMRGDGGPGRFQEMMMTRLKEQFGSNDEEWKVLQPRIQKVMDTQTKLRSSAGSMFRGGPGGENRGGDNRGGERPPAMPEADALRKAVDDAQTPPEKLTAAMKAYRDARKKNEADLATAREELRKLVTVRQEATLVMAGILD